MDERDTANALVLGAWLRAVHAQGAIFAGILMVVSIASLALGVSSVTQGSALNPLRETCSLGWPMALFALQLVVLMPTECVLCLRLQFDAQLFAALGQGQIGLAEVDQGLARSGLRPAQGSTRPLSSRIAGSQRLVRLYAGVLAGQLAVALGICALVGSSVFCLSGNLP